MMAKGVLEIIPDPGPGFYSRPFLVEKASGGWRPIIDLSPLNEFIQQTQFRMETPSSVLLAVRKNDFLASIDLKDAYFQVPVHPASRKLLRFVSNGKVYQFKALCFGLSTAPQVFTRVFAAVSSWAHARGIRLLRYLDDWLILSPSEKQMQQHINQLLSLLLSRHSHKRGEVRPLPVQVCRIYRHGNRHSVCPSVPDEGPNTEVPLPGKEVPRPTEPPGLPVASTAGPHVISRETGAQRETSNALSPVAVEVQLVHQDRLSTPPDTPVQASGHGHRVVDVEGPSSPGGALRGTPPPPELHLYSGASWSGWGAHLLDQSASGLWSNQETSLHINILEMKALFLPLKAFRDLVTNQRVTAMCDNSTVVAYVSKQGGTVSDSLCELTGQLLRWTEDHNVLLEARYPPGQSNVLADLLSRRNQVLEAEWSLLPQVAKKIIRTWGSPTIDLLATHLNAKLPLYCSLIPDPQALFEDAFSHPWNHLDV